MANKYQIGEWLYLKTGDDQIIQAVIVGTEDEYYNLRSPDVSLPLTLSERTLEQIAQLYPRKKVG